MKGSLKLSLAIAFALGSADALALGLGSIQIKSGLNEPLVAEIPVHGTPEETASLSVALATATDFERVGLSRSRLGVPLEFMIAPGSKGGSVIKVTSKEAVKDPFLDFLIEVNWAKGKLLREYTVLLDPPMMAPATKGSRVVTAPLKDRTGTTTSKPLTPSKPTKTTPAVAAAEPSRPRSAPSAAAGGDYGPVASGETLWEVASSTRPDSSVTLNQMMVALLRTNPNAFYQENINSLKRGAIMRIPNADEIKALGSAASAAAEVKNQNDAWRGGIATSKPTLITDTGTSAPRTTGSATKPTKPSDRLELVPPKAASSTQASAERVGSAASGAADSNARAELARTKEALASRDQEASELKSRVRELEDLKNKNDKLLSLKDSELAELQRKLREIQSRPAATTTAPVTSTTTTTTPPTTTTTTPTSTSTTTPTTTVVAPKPTDATSGLTKEDIWGSASGEPTKSPTTTTTTTTTPPTVASTTPTIPPSTTTPTTSGLTPPATTTTTTTTTTTPTDTSSTGTTPSTTITSPSTTTPITGTTTPTTTTPVTTPPKPVSTTTPAKPPVAARVQPLPPSDPWYRKTWVLAVGGLALLGVVALALMNILRRPRPAPVPIGGGIGSAPAYDDQSEEHALLERLAQYPDDSSAHLELASLYYSQQDVDKFEAAAQAMYAHISDTSIPEWQHVREMGRELAPGNPLFASTVSHHAPHTSHAPRSTAGLDFDRFEDASSLATSPPPSHVVEESAFDFDLADRSAPSAPPPAPSRSMRDDFSVDLPSSDSFDTRISTPNLAPTPELTRPQLDDDLIAGDDAIATKLDLAKAYLDMGDPDGARSMLEEVMSEGSEPQKTEARRLLAEIR